MKKNRKISLFFVLGFGLFIGSLFFVTKSYTDLIYTIYQPAVEAAGPSPEETPKIKEINHKLLSALNTDLLWHFRLLSNAVLTYVVFSGVVIATLSYFIVVDIRKDEKPIAKYFFILPSLAFFILSYLVFEKSAEVWSDSGLALLTIGIFLLSLCSFLLGIQCIYMMYVFRNPVKKLSPAAESDPD